MAHRKYADYECKSCARMLSDLPLDSTRCPVCGKKRGFKRLFNSVQVSTRGHRVARFVDRRLAPAYDAKSQKDGADRFKKDATVALDKAWELAPSEAREAAAKANGDKKPTEFKPHMMPAKAAMGMIDPQARRETSERVWPMVNRKVIPDWMQGGRR